MTTVPDLPIEVPPRWRPAGRTLSDLLKLAAAAAVPLFLATALGLSSLNLNTVFEPPLLLPLLNTVFISLVAWAVAYLAANSFRQGAPRVVLAMGGALLALGTGSFVSGALLQTAHGQNVAVTVYNIAALLAALLHVGGVLETLTGRGPRSRGGDRTSRVLVAYGLVLAVVGLTTLLAEQSVIPTFFVQGVGPTVLRQLVLGSAAALFGIASLLVLRLYWNARSDFLYWYAMALALTATGLLIVLLPLSIGNLTNWVGRAAEYMGGLCFFFATLAIAQDRRERGVSFELAIADLFRDAQMNYQALIETSPDAILVADHAGRVLIWNPAAAALLEVDRQQALGARLDEVVHVQAPAASLTAIMKSLLQEDRDRWAGPLDLQVGSRTVSTDVAISVRRPRAGWIGTCILRDVTERRRLRQALHEQEKNYRILFENTADSVTIYDLVCDETGKTVDWVVRDLNPAAERHTGVRRQDAIGKRASELFALPNATALHSTSAHEPVVDGAVRQVETYSAPLGRWFLSTLIPLGKRQYATFEVDITAQKELERELRNANDLLERRVAERTVALKAAVERLHSLSAHLQTVREQDQARFARELHDDLGQILTATRIELNILRETIAEEAAGGQANGESRYVSEALLAEPLRDLDNLVQDGLASLRRLLNELRPEALHRLGLAPAIDKLVQDFQARTGTRAQFSSGLESPVEDNRALALYRIAQEALTNVALHANASHVRVALTREGDFVHLVVADNGRGMPEQATQPGHYGLLGMQERMLALSGTLDLESPPGHGTTVTARLPLAAPAEVESETLN